MQKQRVDLKQDSYDIELQIEEPLLKKEDFFIDNKTLTEEQAYYLSEEKPIQIPLNIFSEEISSLQIIVKYLREIEKLSYAEIAKLLRRDDRTIWTTYNSVKKAKLRIRTQIQGEVPVDVFANRNLSTLEALVVYLKEERALKNREIAAMIQRNNKTIWTVYDRAKKKLKEEA
jgi:DNA-directed RNA polymerase specialized sigma24 family protein